MSYRIKTVSEITGIPKNTLIAWERRYDFPKPERLDNGYRLYSDDELSTLQRVKALLEEGYKISEALLLVDRAADEVPAPHRPARKLEPTAKWAPLDDVREELYAAWLSFDQDRADAALDRLSGTPYGWLLDELLFPLLRRIGEEWARGDVNIAQEHFAAGYTRERLVRMLLSLGSGPAHGRLVGCATFPGEQHELGLLGLAIRLAMNGWRVAWLGANLPPRDLATFADRKHPAMLCVSLVRPVPPVQLEAYARELRDLVSPDVRIVIGGPGVANAHLSVAGVHLASEAEQLFAA